APWTYAFTGALTSTGLATSPDSQFYLYDRLDRLIQVQVGSLAGTKTTVAQYAYDTDNRRIMKKVNLGANWETTQFVYDGWRVLDESAGGTFWERHIWANTSDALLAFERSEGGTWNRYCGHRD